MNMDDIELKLLAGMPIEIVDYGAIHVPTVREVVEIGESKYNQYLSLLLFDKDNLEEKVDYGVSNFEVVFVNCYHSEEFRNMFLDGIEFLFKKKALMCDVTTSPEAFFYFEDGGMIHKDNFDEFQEIVRVGNWIPKRKEEDEIKPGNEQARKFMEKLKQLKKDAPKKKESITLHSTINGMAWKSKDVNVFNIFDLTIYQLKLGFMTLENIDSHSFTLHGVYAGAIDSKNIKFDQIHWAKNLKTN